MISCTAFQARLLSTSRLVRDIRGSAQQVVHFAGLLGSGVRECKQPTVAGGCLGVRPSLQQHATRNFLLRKRNLSTASWPKRAKGCTRAESAVPSSPTSFTMVEYDNSALQPELGEFLHSPTSVLGGQISSDGPSTNCVLFEREDLKHLTSKVSNPSFLDRVIATPWTAVINSLNTNPEPAPCQLSEGPESCVYHLLEYEYVEDVLQRRGPYREAHLKLAAEKCILGGPKGDPIDGAYLIFATDDAKVVEDFVSRDPYVKGGLVPSHKIRRWRIDHHNPNFFAPAVDAPTPLLSRISSMSGFSRVDGRHRNKLWSWEVKSVNGRSLDVRTRVPSPYSSLEQSASAAAAERFARGTISCFLEVKVEKEQQERRLVIDEDAMLKALEAIQRVSECGPSALNWEVPVAFNYGQLLQIPGIIRWEEPEESEEEREEFLRTLTASLHDALDQLLSSRAAEGDRLREVLSGQVAELEALVERAAETAQERLPHLKERMQKQVGDLLETFRTLDPGRLEQEVALLTTRLDVREEVDRLRSHIVAAKDLLDGTHKEAASPRANKSEEDGSRPLSIGRQLDFLCQEFTRECSTICAKSNDVPLTQLAMQMRGVSEQIKEQAANVQ